MNWYEWRYEQMLDMHNRGKTDDQIADYFDLATRTVASILKCGGGKYAMTGKEKKEEIET
jgi:hypothetical protein